MDLEAWRRVRNVSLAVTVATGALVAYLYLSSTSPIPCDGTGLPAVVGGCGGWAVFTLVALQVGVLTVPVTLLLAGYAQLRIDPEW